MLKKSIRVRATASVANVSCGFDCIGYSIAEPSDVLTITTKNKPGIEIIISGPKTDSIPTKAEKNTAGKAVLSYLNTINQEQGCAIEIVKIVGESIELLKPRLIISSIFKLDLLLP